MMSVFMADYGVLICSAIQHSIDAIATIQINFLSLLYPVLPLLLAPTILFSDRDMPPKGATKKDNALKARKSGVTAATTRTARKAAPRADNSDSGGSPS